MRIAQLASNFHTVSPNTNHAIYSHVAALSDGLVERGNEVSLYAAGDSETQAKLLSITEAATSQMGLSEDAIRNYMLLLASNCYQNAESYDIIHSHFNLIGSYFSNVVQTPTVHTLHTPIDDKIKPFLASYKDNYFISFTYAQRTQMPELNWVANIYHGLPIKMFEFNPTPEDYFMYLGRITEDKGVHLAIEAAKAAGVPLIIAGNSYPEEKYWHNFIQKHIDDKSVRYIGEANFETKIQYLKNAKALLFPTMRIEPFGLVMIEAMACGTPVIGFDNGSVSEVIKDKYTGYVVKDVNGMVKAIGNIDKINREECRKRAEMFFSVEKMVTGYERVYLRIIEEHRKKMTSKK